VPRALKPRKRGQPAHVPTVAPEVIEALSVAGIPASRMAVLFGLSEKTIQRRYAGALKPGPKMPAARLAGLVEKLVHLAEQAELTEEIPHVATVVKLLGGLHLPELAASWQPKKTDDGNELPLQPEIGHAD